MPLSLEPRSPAPPSGVMLGRPDQSLTPSFGPRLWYGGRDRRGGANSSATAGPVCRSIHIYSLVFFVLCAMQALGWDGQACVRLCIVMGTGAGAYEHGPVRLIGAIVQRRGPGLATRWLGLRSSTSSECGPGPRRPCSHAAVLDLGGVVCVCVCAAVGFLMRDRCGQLGETCVFMYDLVSSVCWPTHIDLLCLPAREAHDQTLSIPET